MVALGMEFSGQARSRAYVERIFASGRVPPAVLFVGPATSGRSRLALEVARRYLCHSPEAGLRPCGACLACREVPELRYPDFLVFSARSLTAEIAALGAIAGQAEPGALRDAIRFVFRRVTNRINSGYFKLKDGVPGDDELAGRFVALERLIDGAADAATLQSALDEIGELDAGVQHAILPMAGIQEVIHGLSRRPLLSDRRVVFVEGIETFRVEGVNAFLKTLEEPPAGTLILMTAPALETVLPTIRSRSAIVPLTRMRAGEMREYARLRFGLNAAGEVDGANDLYAYLAAQGSEAQAVIGDLARFLDLVRDADRDPSVFEFARELDKREGGPVFLKALEDLLAANLAALESGLGADRVQALALSHYDPSFLRRMLAEVQRLAAGLVRNNLSAAQGIAALVLGFWLEEQAAGAY